MTKPSASFVILLVVGAACLVFAQVSKGKTRPPAIPAVVVDQAPSTNLTTGAASPAGLGV